MNVHFSTGTYAGYGIPVAASLLLHTTLLLLLFVNWSLQSKDEPLQTPPYIKAELVQLNAQAAPAKKQVVEPVIQPVPEPEVTPAPEPQPDREIIERQRQAKLKVEKQKQEKLKQEKLKAEKQKADKQKQEAIEKKKHEEAERVAQDKVIKDKTAADKRKADEALSKAMADEASFQQSLTDKNLAQSYADMIRRRVEESWSRPPSAKKGMEVLLEIQLVPTGYVTGVTVLQSSGNSAFDLSAQQAVHKADRFPEIKDVAPRVFEEHFRRFKMLFKVEDNI